MVGFILIFFEEKSALEFDLVGCLGDFLGMLISVWLLIKWYSTVIILNIY